MSKADGNNLGWTNFSLEVNKANCGDILVLESKELGDSKADSEQVCGQESEANRMWSSTSVSMVTKRNLPRKAAETCFRVATSSW